ncbi:MAG: hypothetical protein IJH64_11340 [Oscillospiraceae bacterium]|nr:hypothetical protein [Oscillospiraceae bacterium]
MGDKIILEELTKEKLICALKKLEPGTMLIIDMPEQKKVVGYAVSTQDQKGDEKDAAAI